MLETNHRGNIYIVANPWILGADELLEAHTSNPGVSHCPSGDNECVHVANGAEVYLAACAAGIAQIRLLGSGNFAAAPLNTYSFTVGSPVPAPAPPVPTGLTGTPGDGSITLDWNDDAHATGYQVQQWDGRAGSWRRLP